MLAGALVIPVTGGAETLEPAHSPPSATAPRRAPDAGRPPPLDLPVLSRVADRQHLAHSAFRALPKPVRFGAGSLELEGGIELRWDLRRRSQRRTFNRQRHAFLLLDRFATEADERAQLTELAGEFSEFWSQPDVTRVPREVLRAGEASLEEELAVRLRARLPAMRRSARRELEVIVRRKVAPWRQQLQLWSARAHGIAVREGGTARDQYYAAVAETARAVHEHTRSLYDSTFPLVEGPSFDQRVGCRTDTDFAPYDERQRRAEQAIADLQGRALVDILAAIDEPRRVLDRLRSDAELESRGAFTAVLESLSQLDATRSGEMAELAARLEGQLALALAGDAGEESPRATEDFLDLRERVDEALTSANWELFRAVEKSNQLPRATVQKFGRALGEIRRRCRRALRAEVNAFQRRIREIAADTRAAVAEVAEGHARYCERFHAEHEFRPALHHDWVRTPFDAIPPARARRTPVGELLPEITFHYDSGWTERSPEELDLHCRALLTVQRFAQGVLDRDQLRELASRFTEIWTRDALPTRDQDDLARVLLGVLLELDANIQEAARVELAASVLRSQRAWRARYGECVAGLRELAAWKSGDHRRDLPGDGVAMLWSSSQTCADLLEDCLGRCAAVEVAHCEALARLPAEDELPRLQALRDEAVEVIDRTVMATVAAVRERTQQSFAASQERCGEIGQVIGNILDGALAEMDALDRTQEAARRDVSAALRERLSALLEERPPQPSLRQQLARIDRIREFLERADRRLMGAVQERQRELGRRYRSARTALEGVAGDAGSNGAADEGARPFDPVTAPEIEETRARCAEIARTAVERLSGRTANRAPRDVTPDEIAPGG